jgi:hypothetical protein
MAVVLRPPGAFQGLVWPVRLLRAVRAVRPTEGKEMKLTITAEWIDGKIRVQSDTDCVGEMFIVAQLLGAAQGSIMNRMGTLQAEFGSDVWVFHMLAQLDVKEVGGKMVVVRSEKP